MTPAGHVDAARLRMSGGQFSAILTTMIGATCALLIRLGAMETKIEVLAEKHSAQLVLNDARYSDLAKAKDDLESRMRRIEEKVR